jgi:hypothetical protein
MSPRIILLVLLLGTGCRSGLLPCPHAKTVRMKKNNVYKPLRQFMASMSANAGQQGEDNIHSKSFRNADDNSVDNISVEEWDCPHPGAKKYMPKSVKDNIRKNMHKINKDTKTKADSVVVR